MFEDDDNIDCDHNLNFNYFARSECVFYNQEKKLRSTVLFRPHLFHLTKCFSK